jgi:hypothetical protein
MVLDEIAFERDLSASPLSIETVEEQARLDYLPTRAYSSNVCAATGSRTPSELASDILRWA